VSPDVLAGRLRSIVDVDASAELSSSHVPLMYIRPDQDRLLGPRVLKHLETLRPDMTVRTLAGPHLILQRQPEEAARAVSEFLAEAAAK
jgi:hypothetical protein